MIFQLTPPWFYLCSHRLQNRVLLRFGAYALYFRVWVGGGATLVPVLLCLGAGWALIGAGAESRRLRGGYRWRKTLRRWYSSNLTAFLMTRCVQIYRCTWNLYWSVLFILLVNSWKLIFFCVCFFIPVKSVLISPSQIINQNPPVQWNQPGNAKVKPHPELGAITDWFYHRHRHPLAVRGHLKLLFQYMSIYIALEYFFDVFLCFN